MITLLFQNKPPVQTGRDMCPALTEIVTNLDSILPAITQVIGTIGLITILHCILATIPNYKL